MKKHSILLFGHATSFSIEEEFWETLKELAKEKNTSVRALIQEIDAKRKENLSSAIRLFILKEVKKNNVFS